MSLTATDNVTELDISELVDTEKEPACEHSGHPASRWGHSGPAWAIIRCTPHCGLSSTLLICKGGYEYGVMSGYVRCRRCQATHPVEEAWQLVSIL